PSGSRIWARANQAHLFTMTRALALCSVAMPALCAVSATAQVSVPLPQSSAESANPATVVPLPGAAAPPPAPESPIAQLPIGPHGRPDINPYDRDIDMTVPLTFQSRSLGDIPMRLTADDRFLLDAATFVRLMQAVLNEDAHATLAQRLASYETFGPEDLTETGVQLTYDPSSLAVVVVEVAPEQRAVQDLFAPPRDDLQDISLEPASLSAFLNLNLIQTYVWEGSQADPPTINLDGAVRFGRIVFEGDAQVGQQFTMEGDKYQF